MLRNFKTTYSEIKDLLDKMPERYADTDKMSELLSAYVCSDTADSNTFNEIRAGAKDKERGKVWQKLWEAAIYKYINSLGYKFIYRKTHSGKIGPDFGFTYNEQKIWVEATFLMPNDAIKSVREKFDDGKAISFPHQDIKLKWTSAIREKNKKCLKWIESEAIAEKDIIILAINGSGLFRYPYFGMSQLPIAVEAVYPVGALRIDGNKVEPSYCSTVIKQSKRQKKSIEIKTDGFLSDEYKYISALLGSSCDSLIIGGYDVVHNECANNKCPKGIFKNCSEFDVIDHKESNLIELKIY